MNVYKERRVLKSMLKARDKKPFSSGVRTLVYVLMWLGIVFSSILYIKHFGKPTTKELIFYGAFWLSGILIGIISFYDVARKQWPAIQPHINYESIEKRINEIEA